MSAQISQDRGLRRGDRVDVEPRTARGNAAAPGGPGTVEKAAARSDVLEEVVVRLDCGLRRLVVSRLVTRVPGRSGVVG